MTLREEIKKILIAEKNEQKKLSQIEELITYTEDNELNLSKLQLHDAEAQVIAAALKQNNSLTKINLGENKIGIAGNEALIEAIKENKNLIAVEMNFSHTRFIRDIRKNSISSNHDSQLNNIGLDWSQINADQKIKEMQESIKKATDINKKLAKLLPLDIRDRKLQELLPTLPSFQEDKEQKDFDNKSTKILLNKIAEKIIIRKSWDPRQDQTLDDIIKQIREDDKQTTAPVKKSLEPQQDVEDYKPDMQMRLSDFLAGNEESKDPLIMHLSEDSEVPHSQLSDSVSVNPGAIPAPIKVSSLQSLVNKEVEGTKEMGGR